LPNRPFTVGFAAETENVLSYARSKLEQKSLDLVIANDVSQSGIGFNADENEVTLVSTAGDFKLPRDSKHSLAQTLIEQIAELMGANEH
jgi:phosphopantothenoylcysteine decarboxylase/phosphopantothenate--cysteine ligase